MAETTPAILVTGDSRLSIELLAAAIGQHHRVLPSLTPGEARKENVDIVIVHAPGIERCTALLKECKSVLPSAAIIVVGGPFGEEEFVDAIALGAVASIADNGSVTGLMELIEAVRRGEAQCSGRVASMVFARVAALAKTKQAEEPEAFTSRESDVFQLVRAGLSNKEIAQILSLSVSTVKNHVHQILAKLQIRSRRDAIDWDTRMQRVIDLRAAAAGSQSQASGTHRKQHAE